MKAWVWAITAAIAFLAAAVQPVRAQDAENCVVTGVGNSIADQMAGRTERDMRRAITPALRKFNLGCLARTIRLGGFGRLGSWSVGRDLLRILEQLSRPDGLCQVVLDQVGAIDPAPVRSVFDLAPAWRHGRGDAQQSNEGRA